MIQRLFLFLSDFISKVHRVYLVVLLCSILCLASTAKCAEVERADADVVPTREELRLQLRPLTDEELKKQADVWQVRVQKKVAEVSELQLKKRRVQPIKRLSGFRKNRMSC